MSPHVRPILLAAGLLAAGCPVAAQSTSPAACPDPAVATVSPDSLVAHALSRLARVSIDTSYTLSIDRERWTATKLSASTAAGLAGMERASWAACAGARVHIERADISLENVQGRVRIRASVEPLLELLRRHSSQTR